MTQSKLEAFNVHTIATGFNGGRTYCFRVEDASSSAASLESCNEWVAQIKKASKIAIQRVAHNTFIQTTKVTTDSTLSQHISHASMLWQLRMQQLLTSHLWQRTFGLIIFLNFVINMVQSQTLPGDDSPFGHIFNVLDITFTAVSVP